MVFSDDFLHFLKIKKKFVEFTKLSCGFNSLWATLNLQKKWYVTTKSCTMRIITLESWTNAVHWFRLMTLGMRVFTFLFFSAGTIATLPAIDLQANCAKLRTKPARVKISNAMVTPLRKAASYEPRIAILGIWGDTWITRGKYGIYVAVRGSYGALTGSTWRLLPRKISPIYCRVSYVVVTRIPSLVLRDTLHYMIIRYSYGELPKADLRCSYEAALRKGVTTA